MRLLIDGDVLRYEIGAVCQSLEVHFGVPQVLPHSPETVAERTHQVIERIVDRAGGDHFEIFLSGGSNYRFDIAVSDPYKGQRVGAKPYHWATVGNILCEDYGAWTVHGAEADDAMSIYAREDPEDTIIASRDKDLRIVPCWHYSWRCGERQPEVPTHKVEELGSISAKKYDKGGYKLLGEGLKFFYGQVLCGDQIDNYKGCPSVGAQTAVGALAGCTTERELWEATYWTYRKKLGEEEGLRRLIENARLAWLLTEAEVEYDAHDSTGNPNPTHLRISPRSLWEPPAAVPTGF